MRGVRWGATASDHDRVSQKARPPPRSTVLTRSFSFFLLLFSYTGFNSQVLDIRKRGKSTNRFGKKEKERREESPLHFRSLHFSLAFFFSSSVSSLNRPNSDPSMKAVIQRVASASVEVREDEQMERDGKMEKANAFYRSNDQTVVVVVVVFKNLDLFSSLSLVTLSLNHLRPPSIHPTKTQVDGALVSSIGRGILVLVGVAHGDGPADVDWVARKLLSARLFPPQSEGECEGDGQSTLNAAAATSPPPRWSASVSDLPGGEILCVSQFTLLGSLAKGTKPDFKRAAAPAEAVETYNALLDRVREGFKEPGRVKDGVFGAMMKVR